MKVALLFIALIASSQAHALAAQSTAVVSPLEGSFCSIEFAGVIAVVIILAQTIYDMDIARAIEIVPVLIKAVKAFLVCVFEMPALEVYPTVMRFVSEDRKECLDRHVRLVIHDFKLALEDLAHLKVDKFQQDIQGAVNGLNAAYQKC